MAGPDKGGVVHIPWYVTGFRGNDFADRVAAFAPVVMRYGATDYEVFRSRDDRYRFLQVATFEHKFDFERFWQSEEAIAFRVNNQGWYQVPLLYVWHDRIAAGGFDHGEPEAAVVETTIVETTIVEATIIDPTAGDSTAA